MKRTPAPHQQGRRNASWLVAYLEALFDGRELGRYNPASATKQLTLI